MRMSLPRGKSAIKKFPGTDDLLPTEEEINEWTRRSRKEGVCGIINCFNKPTTQCKKCTTYYCSEHFSPHIDLLADGDYKYASSNEDLERYMDEIDALVQMRV